MAPSFLLVDNVLAVAKENKYMVLDLEQQETSDVKLMVQIYSRKQVLLKADMKLLFMHSRIFDFVKGEEEKRSSPRSSPGASPAPKRSALKVNVPSELQGVS